MRRRRKRRNRKRKKQKMKTKKKKKKKKPIQDIRTCSHSKRLLMPLICQSNKLIEAASWRKVFLGKLTVAEQLEKFHLFLRYPTVPTKARHTRSAKR